MHRPTDERYERAQTLAMVEQISGKHSGDYDSVLRSIGWHHATTGAFDRAIPLLREGLAAGRERFAGDDPLVLTASTRLASALIGSGHADDEAKGLLDAAMAGWSGKDDAGTIHPMPTRVALARWFALHDDGRADALLDQVDAGGENVEVAVRADALAVRAEIARRRGEPDIALRLAREAWNVLHDRLGAAHPLTVRAGLRAADDLRASRSPDEAQALESRLRPLLDAALPDDSVWRKRAMPLKAAQPAP